MHRCVMGRRCRLPLSLVRAVSLLSLSLSLSLSLFSPLSLHRCRVESTQNSRRTYAATSAPLSACGVCGVAYAFVLAIRSCFGGRYRRSLSKPRSSRDAGRWQVSISLPPSLSPSLSLFISLSLHLPVSTYLFIYLCLCMFV